MADKLNPRSRMARRMLGDSYKSLPIQTSVPQVQHVMLKDVRAIPVRETLQAIYKIFRDKSIKEAVIFTGYFILFILIASQIWDVHASFSTNDSLIDLLIDEEFSDANYKKNFNEIMTQTEFWDWMEGPLAEGLYPDEWYNGQLYSDTQKGYVLDYYRMVGGVQLRQLRVSNVSCTERRFLGRTAVHDGEVLGRFDNKDGSCWDEYSSSNEYKAPYGPNGVWSYSTGLSHLEGLFGFGPSGGYGDGGYVTELPLDRETALAELQFMKSNMWVDRGTRAVAINFNLYNTNTKLVTAVRIVFEFYPSAHIVHWYKFYTFRVVLYEAYLDQVRLVGEFLYVCASIYYLQKEARRIYWWKPRYKYFTQFRNLFELIVIVGHFVVITFWIRFIASSSISAFDVNVPQYVDLFPVASEFILIFTFIGVISLLNSLKIFKYLGISKKMNALWLTLRKASSDLLAFGLGFIVIVLGFAIMANLMFGYRLREFHNVSASFSTLMRFPLGDFNYNRLSDTRPVLAGLFFSLYVGMVFIVIVNMFIGIITKYFEEVHEEVKVADRWKTSAKKWEATAIARLVQLYVQLSTRLAWMCPCRRKTHIRPTNVGDEAETLHRESLFMSHVHKCMQDAKRNRNLDLFAHFEQLYEQSDLDSDRMYIGVHELCTLVTKTPCNPLEHNTCRAAQLVEAYNNVKSVMMVGDCRPHQSINSDIEAGELKMFTVVKINRNGYRQHRQVAVAYKKNAILNFSTSGRHKKTVPLKQLVQIEKSATNPAFLALVFSSGGAEVGSMDANQDVHDYETTYELLFPDWRRREEFVSQLLESVRNAFAAAPSGGGVDDGSGGGGGAGAGPGFGRSGDTRGRTPSAAGSSTRAGGPVHQLSSRLSSSSLLSAPRPSLPSAIGPPTNAATTEDVAALRNQIFDLKSMVGDLQRNLSVLSTSMKAGGAGALRMSRRRSSAGGHHAP